VASGRGSPSETEPPHRPLLEPEGLAGVGRGAPPVPPGGHPGAGACGKALSNRRKARSFKHLRVFEVHDGPSRRRALSSGRHFFPDMC